MSDLLQRVRRTPERVLHPLRRRKALARLRARSRPKSVLVVCHGNICRSPFAAALLARELATRDVIVVMEMSQQRLICERFGHRPADVLVLGDLDPATVETRTIRDPVNEGREVFDQVYERIARCVREFVTILDTPE